MKRTGSVRRSRGFGHRRQQGVVLFVALIVLVVMTMAGLAMMRQIGGSVSIAGNLAFKENATSVADAGTETGRDWFVNKTSYDLKSDVVASGYSSNWSSSVDPTTFPWDTASVDVSLDTSSSNRVRYIVHRLCQSKDLLPTDPGQKCSDYLSNNTGGSHGGGSYGVVPLTAPPTPFFRVTTRVDGPRNTVSYIQVVTN